MEDVKPTIVDIDGEAVDGQGTSGQQVDAGGSVPAENGATEEATAGRALEAEQAEIDVKDAKDPEGLVATFDGPEHPDADGKDAMQNGARTDDRVGQSEAPVEVAVKELKGGSSEPAFAPEHDLAATTTGAAEIMEDFAGLKQPDAVDRNQLEVKGENGSIAHEPAAPAALSQLEDNAGSASGVAPAEEDASAQLSGQPSAISLPSQEYDPTPTSLPPDMSPGLDPAALEALALAATSASPPPPPPPPLHTTTDSLEHVDVDLGPLKSVSRNHAKINYLTDLGHFCLEIYGRNGAWVDDRYFVRGSIVPLNQG